jgi:N-acetylneuraminic acid mutarotase
MSRTALVLAFAACAAGCGSKSGLLVDLTGRDASAPSADAGPSSRGDAGAVAIQADAGRTSAVEGGNGSEDGCCAKPGTPQIVLFGGSASDGEVDDLSDTWTFDGEVWTQIEGPGPSAREGASMARLGDGRVVLFGGYGPAAQGTYDVFSDTWTFDGTAWTQVRASGPIARARASMATLGDQVVLFGGYNQFFQPSPLSDTWLFDGASWTQVGASGPPGRSDASMATFGGAVVLVGGQGCADSLCYSEVPESDAWRFDGSSWTQLAGLVGTWGYTGGALAPVNEELVLFGGWDGFEIHSDTWAFDGASWTPLDVTGPSGRDNASAAALAGRLVLYGGYDVNTLYSDTWQFDGTAWTQLHIPGPPARQAAATSAF